MIWSRWPVGDHVAYLVISPSIIPTVVDWLRDREAIGLNISYFVSSERSPASAGNRGINQVATPFVAVIKAVRQEHDRRPRGGDLKYRAGEEACLRPRPFAARRRPPRR
jgi:hypothetical protein